MMHKIKLINRAFVLDAWVRFRVAFSDSTTSSADKVPYNAVLGWLAVSIKGKVSNIIAADMLFLGLKCQFNKPEFNLSKALPASIG